MKGDFSRDSYQRALGFSRVLLQQGRVLLDADWNEQTAILLDYIRTLATDLLGPHAGPRDNLGFGLYTTGTSPDGLPPALQERLKKLQPGNVLIGPGHYYVDGILVANTGLFALNEQPGRQPGPQPDQAGRLLYLEVWERHVTASEVPAIWEPALGDVDTATRAQIVWQMRALKDPGLPSREEALKRDPESGEVAWRKALGLGSKGRLAAQAVGGDTTSDLCDLPSDARYRGLEHQLYRVEVHRSGEVTAPATDMRTEGGRRATRENIGLPEFKWSRDNGSVAVAIESIPETAVGERPQVRVASLGRDSRAGIVVGTYVEITDDETELGVGDSAAPLGTVYELDPLERIVEVDGLDVTRFEPALHPLLRRWDGRGVIVPGRWLPLEDGIQVRFEPGVYRAGDYWLIPARAGVPGDVLWPRQPVKGGDEGETEAVALPPHGIERHYAPIALISEKDEVTDLRCTFETLECRDPSAPAGKDD